MLTCDFFCRWEGGLCILMFKCDFLQVGGGLYLNVSCDFLQVGREGYYYVSVMMLGVRSLSV